MAGAAGVGLGIKSYVETNNPFTLIPAAVGLLLLIYGGLAGCCSIMAGKLHRIEWYLAQYFRQK